MGAALADAAAEYGANITLILGPAEVVPGDYSVKIVRVKNAESMAKECISRFPGCDIAILSAAVSDYTPSEPVKKKISRTTDEFVLKLKPTADIAAALGRMKKNSQFLAGFALETNNEINNAKAKLKKKNLDIIVLNSLREKGAGFGSDTNRITIIDRYNNINKFELKTKANAARDILDKIVSMLK